MSVASQLLQKIQARQRARDRFGGLDQLLFDLTPVDQSEFVIYKRTHSMLIEKINQRKKSGELADYVQSLIQRQLDGICQNCWKPKQSTSKFAAVRADGYCKCMFFDHVSDI